jgi:hypothetical protein
MDGERLEARRRGSERAAGGARDPETVYWSDLVQRVEDRAGGLRSLSRADRTYYAVRSLVKQVHDGGFDQFFSGNGGALYGLTLDGLFELDADACASLLVRAKEVLFGAAHVPLDRNLRLKAMSTTDNPHAPEWAMLESLDEAFWRDPDGLSERCSQFGRSHCLFAQG